MGQTTKGIDRQDEFIKAIEAELGLNAVESDRHILSFREFVDKVYPRYQWYKHCEVLGNVLQRVADGELKRVLIFAPPRHGKSQLATRLFPAYYLYRHPEKWVGINSYGADLAHTFSRAARDAYHDAGGQMRDDSSAVKHWELPEGGGCWAAGVGGPITGKGFSCFPKGVMVTTELGRMDIATLCQLSDPPRVLSFNHESNSLEWKRIVAVRIKPARNFVEISLHSGSKVRCTPEHPIFNPESGYKPSSDFVPGETVIEIAQVQEVRSLSEAHREANPVHGLLSADSRLSLSDEMHFLQQGVREAKIRDREGIETGQYRVLLRGGMLSQAPQHQTPQHQTPQTVQGMWRSRNGDENKLLLSAVHPRSRSSIPTIAGQNLLDLQHSVQPEVIAIGLLLQGLPEQGALKSDDRQGQQPLQDRHKLCSVVQGDEERNQGERSVRVRRLRKARTDDSIEANAERRDVSDSIELGNPSHRLRSTEQQPREPGSSVWGMPQEAPQIDRCWQAVPISRVDRLCGSSELVYDIQVEDNHNFFANEILVHNCGIIDDPLKNSEEAFSDRIRNRQKDWYNSTFYTRGEQDAAIVVILTRWHEDDLAGWLLFQENSEDDDPEAWHVVNFEAIKEEVVPKFPATCTLEPDWREPGEPLCPERMALRRLLRIKKKNAYFWSALYQQSPSPLEGDSFKRAWWKFYTQPPAKFDQVIQSWDCAFKETSTSDFVVGQVWGKKDGEYWLLDQVRGRMDINATLTAIRTLTGKYPNARAKLVEDKANGSAVIGVPVATEL